MPIVSTLLNAVSRVDPLTALGTVVALLSSYIFYNTYIYPRFLSPLRFIPGPPNKSKHNKYGLPFLGNFLDVIMEDAGAAHLRWIEQYGGILRYHGLFGAQTVLIADPKAINHVFNTHTYDYFRPGRVVRLMSAIIGSQGVFLAEGDVHKRQRKMLSPAFSYKHIKELTPVIAGPSKTLSQIWEGRVDESETGAAEFDITMDMSHATLDIVGIAGFGYDFQSLTDPTNELGMAYRELFDTTSTAIQLLRGMIPFYAKIPFKHNLHRQHAIAAMDRATTRMITEKMERAQANATSGSKDGDSSNVVGKDIMSVMIQGNEGAGEEGKLSMRELKDQIMTFLVAGHETTSTTITWLLYVLSTHQEHQTKLRNELLTAFGRPDGDSIPFSYDTLSSLPYLNACIKEIMRRYPVVPTTSRVANRDDEILGYTIPKGTQVYLSPVAMHQLKSVFGEDAEEFKPERWMDPEEVACENPQLAAATKFVTADMGWAYQPFLTGPRNCVGSRFALIEVKILVYYLLINLEYHPVPGFTFSKSAFITYRPSPGMRLIVKKYNHGDKSGSTAASAL